MHKHFKYGFTLIELIIVIAIIVAIAAAAFVAIDPARRLHAAKNSTRWSDITAILEATKKYQADNDGSWPSTAVAIDSATSTYQLIGTSVGTCGSATCAVLATGSIAATNCGVTGLATDIRPYLKKMPWDPTTGNASDTRYYINKDQYGILTVGSCDAEGEDGGGEGAAPAVEVTR